MSPNPISNFRPSPSRQYLRHLVGLAILAFWLVMMASLYRERFAARAGGEKTIEPEQLVENWTNYEEFLQARQDGNDMGYLALSAKRETDGGNGYMLQFRGSLDDTGNENPALRVKVAARLDKDFQLDKFTASAYTAPHSFSIEGFNWNERLYLKFSRDGEASRRAYWPLEGQISLLQAIQPLVARSVDLKEGDRYRIEAFDPIWFGGVAGQASVEIGGFEEVFAGGKMSVARPMRTTLAGNTVTAWVGEDNVIVKYELLDGLTLERVSREQALDAQPTLDETTPLPQFDVNDYAQDMQAIDLSQGNALSNLARIAIEMAEPKP